jgi:site-specific DNA recombinase
VKIILSNRLYIGEYSVAGYNENIPELKIIDDLLYEEARKVRHRYKIAGTARKRMPLNRRKDKLENLLDKFRSCLSNKSSESTLKEVYPNVLSS